MLELRSISKTFNAGTINEKKALVNVSLKLNDGDFCTVIGGNGAGKSTVMNAVAGVWPVDSGQILIGGGRVCTTRIQESGLLRKSVSGSDDRNRRRYAD